MPRFTDIGSYVTGYPYAGDKGFLVLSIDDAAEKKIPHCVVICWEHGKFTDLVQNAWLLADLAPIGAENSDEFIFLGTHGNFLQKSTTRSTEGTIDSQISVHNRGPLRAAKNIDGYIYIVGGDRQAYRMSSDRTVVDIGASLVPKDDTIVSLESIDGFNSKEIYAVGLRGEIWRYDSSSWHSLASPTNLLLTSLCCAEDGHVYICGLKGALVKGRSEKWEFIDIGEFPYDFWDICWFKGQLYLATMHTVYVLKNDSVIPVDSGARTCGKLTSDGITMWSIGAKDVMAFDGNQWQRID